ncbi:MAG: hypothetical protein CNLJKLNK_00661 [Holosporales bacterium]
MKKYIQSVIAVLIVQGAQGEFVIREEFVGISPQMRCLHGIDDTLYVRVTDVMHHHKNCFVFRDGEYLYVTNNQGDVLLKEFVPHHDCLHHFDDVLFEWDVERGRFIERRLHGDARHAYWPNFLFHRHRIALPEHRLHHEEIPHAKMRRKSIHQEEKHVFKEEHVPHNKRIAPLHEQHAHHR